MTTGDKIRRIRRKRRLTQAELAMMSGLSLSAIQGYEQGRYEPKRKSLESIAEVFKIPVDELYDMPAELGTNLAEVGTDLISRQAAIDAVKRLSLGETDATRLAMRTEDYLERLKSAQPEPIRINLNEPIKVKLTDWGKEIYYHQYDMTNQIAGRKICEPRFPKEDENGYTEFQLWCFIELYGEHMRMTMPNVIEPLEIVYER